MSRRDRVLAVVAGPRALRRPTVRRAWRTALRSPLVGSRRGRLTGVIAARMAAAGQGDAAEELLADIAGRVSSATEQAELRLAAARTGLAAGRPPQDRSSVLAGALRLADADWSAGRRKQAAERLTDVLNIAFHRAEHFDGLTSALATDPADFLAPLRASTTYQAAQLPRGRQRPATTSAPRRLLVVSYKNWNFLGRILGRYDARPGLEVRRVDLADLPVPVPLSVAQLTRERLLGPADASTRPWATPLREHLDWCDTVWVEWGQRAAVVLSLLDPGDARVIVRVHSYEAFSAFPHLVDWSRVDDLVFVGEQVREFARQVVPALDGGPRLHVLPNAMDLGRFGLPKQSSARHTLALIGWSAVAKDPGWALDVLGRLRSRDDRYRLLLVGSPLDPAPSRAAAAARTSFDARLAAPDVAGGVEQVGQVDDVPATLTRVGVILSASVRESFHQAVAEGAASGAVPVVRDWPMYSAYGGARAVFPGEWVVDGVDAAVDRILATTGDEHEWAAAGAAARAAAVERFDWERVALRYDALLGLGG